MRRWLPALLLALGLHLLLFRVIIPIGETRPPTVSGSRQVTVTLARPEQQQGHAAQESPAKTVHAEKARVSPASRFAPEKGKNALPARMERLDHYSPVAQLPQDASRSAAPPADGAEEAGPVRKEAGGQESAGATVRQAVPLPTDNRPPEYPALARKRGWEGRVLLAVDVSADGTVQAARLQTGSGHDLFDEAALGAVRKWRFQPGTRDGEPVAMQVLVPVHFILKDNP